MSVLGYIYQEVRDAHRKQSRADTSLWWQENDSSVSDDNNLALAELTTFQPTIPNWKSRAMTLLPIYREKNWNVRNTKQTIDSYVLSKILSST